MGRSRLRAGRLGRAAGIVLVGSGTHFISGISYYTHRLALTLGETEPVGVILMRKLIPRFLYPGKDRVGAPIADLSYPSTIPVVDGIDWYGGPGLIRALILIAKRRPAFLILQWWTGAVLHNYVVLAAWAKLLGADVVLEFHEVQDTGEAMMIGAAQYVRLGSRVLMAMTSGAVVHSESDLQPIHENYGTANKPTTVITLGPFDQFDLSRPIRDAPADVTNILFFGTIRPYKGLEDLVEAFNALDDETVKNYWLTVVGETWEGWTGPLDLIDASPHRDRITLVNRYLTDAELGQYLAGADVAALPYRRSSASGPLHVAMSVGIPTIVTSVGGLPEAARGYEGALWVPPADPGAIGKMFAVARALGGARFADPASWEITRLRYIDHLTRVGATGGSDSLN